MATPTLYQLKRERNQYIELKDDLERMMIKINTSMEELDNVDRELNQIFEINDEVIHSSGVQNTRQTLKRQQDYIRNTIIPEINLRIMRLKKEIKELEFT